MMTAREAFRHGKRICRGKEMKLRQKKPEPKHPKEDHRWRCQPTMSGPRS